MRALPFVLFAALAALPVQAQADPAAKARLDEAVAAAQKAYDAGNFEQVEDLLREVGSLVHDDAAALMLRAKANFEIGDWGRASSFAQRAAQLQPGHLEAHLLAGKALFQQAEEARGEALGSGSRVGGFYDGALGQFEECLKIKADDPDVLILKARCLYALNRTAEAVPVYEALRKVSPDDPTPCLYLAQAHAQAGNPDLAVKVATEGLVAKGASNIRGDLAQVIFNLLKDRPAQVEEIFKRWTAAHPNDPQAWLWLGYMRGIEKKYDEALAHYQKGFDASGKKHPGLALEMGNTLVQRGDAKRNDFDKAAEWYGTALKLQTQWNNYEMSPLGRLNVLAANYVQQRDYEKAVGVLEKHAFPAADADWSTLNVLGLFYRDWADSGKKSDARSRNEKALSYYLKASKLVVDADVSPSLKAGVLNDTGVIYDYQLGDIEKGVEYYRQALEHDPEWIDALENLGLCFNKLGKYEEAIPLFQKVVDQVPGRAKSVRGLAEARRAVEKDGKPK